MGYAKYLSLAYNCVLMIPFGVMSGDLVPELWPGIKTEACPRGRGACEPTLEFTTGRIYLQVICGVAFMYGAMLAFKGTQAMLASMLCMVLTMGKHILVDGLIPPPPVMVMVGLTLAAILAGSGEWPKRAYIAFCLVNAFTFITQPLMVLQDTFPAITADSPAYELGAFCFEVIALCA